MFFFFNDTATTEIYTLSLHDALPICLRSSAGDMRNRSGPISPLSSGTLPGQISRTKGSAATADQATIKDRKSTRLNSSHGYISYAVFCLKKKKNNFFKVAKSADTLST